MKDYTYNGWCPYGAGQRYMVDHWCDSDPWEEDCFPTKEAIKNGCEFIVVNEQSAYLIPPTKAEEHRILFRRINHQN